MASYLPLYVSRQTTWLPLRTFPPERRAETSVWLNNNVLTRAILHVQTAEPFLQPSQHRKAVRHGHIDPISSRERTWAISVCTFSPSTAPQRQELLCRRPEESRICRLSRSYNCTYRYACGFVVVEL